MDQEQAAEMSDGHRVCANAESHSQPAVEVIPDSAEEYVDAAVMNLMKSGEIEKIYNKWFMSPIPPKGINLNLPMSAALKKAVASPTDSGDPAKY